MAAFRANEARHVAVEFIHDCVARNGVQVVDVLRNDAAQTAFLLPFREDEMPGIGLDVLVAEEVVEHFADDAPRLFGVAVVEVDVERVGVVLVPDAALATEGRDATFSGSARAREAYDILGFREDFGGLLDFFGIHGFKIAIQVQNYGKKHHSAMDGGKFVILQLQIWLL